MSEFAETWQRRLNDPDYLWPEDVITEEEWERGWFDRQLIAGRRRPKDRANTPIEFGGDLVGGVPA